MGRPGAEGGLRVSAGGIALPNGLKEYRGLDCLAPRMRGAVESALLECRASGLDVMVWESCRSQELQELYYKRGRPPTPEYPSPVTWQRNAMRAWHFYGLAVDVISEENRWFALTRDMTHGLTGDALEAVRRARHQQAAEWFARVATIFIRYGCDWGGHWVRQDPPHMQWGHCRPSPSQLSIDAFVRGGKPAVWELVRAA